VRQKAVHSIIDSWQELNPKLKLPEPEVPQYGVIVGGTDNYIKAEYSVIVGGKFNNISSSYLTSRPYVPDPNTVQR